MKRTTKKQRKARVKKLSANRRIANALRKFVRSNPAVPVSMRKAKALGIRKNKNSVTIRVLNPGSAVRWGVKTWQGTVGAWARKSDATAYAKRLREANKQAGNRGSVKVVKVSS